MWWDSLPRKDADKLNCNALPRKTRSGDFRNGNEAQGRNFSGNAWIANGLVQRDANMRLTPRMECAKFLREHDYETAMMARICCSDSANRRTLSCCKLTEGNLPKC